MAMTLEQASAKLAQITGHAGNANKHPNGEPAVGIVTFETAPDMGQRIVAKNSEAFLAAGIFLFDFEYGFGRGPDTIAIADTTDKFEVVRRAGTDASNYGHDTEDVITWLREIDADNPFRLTGAGFDFVAGSFPKAPKNLPKLAKTIYAFCPDFVDQGIGLHQQGEPHELIEKYFDLMHEFFFWWD